MSFDQSCDQFQLIREYYFVNIRKRKNDAMIRHLKGLQKSLIYCKIFSWLYNNSYQMIIPSLGILCLETQSTVYYWLLIAIEFFKIYTYMLLTILIIYI